MPLLTAQTPDSIKTVQLTAEVSDDPPSITLHWFPRTGTTNYRIYKKDPLATGWGAIAETLDGAETSWTDSDIEPGKLYQYRVQRVNSEGGGNGYIHSGLDYEVPPIAGKLLIALDTTQVRKSDAFFITYLDDLVREGWQFQVLEVDRTAPTHIIKEQITEAWNMAGLKPRALFLVGRVPVPYSGYIFPDGHGPGSGNHNGAWPADPYYADIDGSWTDISINDETANDPRNRNVPGDGKWDQSSIPSDVELETGRVDFSNLPAFALTERELLEAYFKKNHAFRTQQFIPQYRGLIENNFAGFTEGFGQNGLRNFTAMFGVEETHYRDYDMVKDESYLWVYGCGAGNYQGASGIANTNGFAQDSIQAVFTMHFGSFFGDWDSPSNNFLKAALGSGTILTNAWAARPNWFFYPMAMGETIGYCYSLSLNNSASLHDPGFSARGVHMALLGDPTLRLYPVAPASNLMLEETDMGIRLSWDGPGEDVAGYHVFRFSDDDKAFVQINESMIPEKQFTDPCPLDGLNSYMVRAVHRTTSASGRFLHSSPGVVGSILSENNYLPEAFFTWEADMESDSLLFSNASTGAESYQWDFGDGTGSVQENPGHQYTQAGPYVVSLIAANGCGADTIALEVTVVLSSVKDSAENKLLFLYPNPSGSGFYIAGSPGRKEVSVFSLQGNRLYTSVGNEVNYHDMGYLPAGSYLVKLASGEQKYYQLWMKL